MNREAQLATGERYNISSRANQNVRKENATIIFRKVLHAIIKLYQEKYA